MLPTSSTIGTKVQRTNTGDAVEAAVEREERQDLAQEEGYGESVTAAEDELGMLFNCSRQCRRPYEDGKC